MKLLGDDVTVKPSSVDPAKSRQALASFRDALQTKQETRKRKLSEASDGDVSVDGQRDKKVRIAVYFCFLHYAELK